MAKKKSATAKVESIRHRDKRANTPTEELRDFVKDDEARPKTVLYGTLLGEAKQPVRSAQYEALKAVNQEFITLYWDIGRMIAARQEGKTRGKAVVERLAADPRAEFPGVGGLSASNLWRMKGSFEAYEEQTNETAESK